MFLNGPHVHECQKWCLNQIWTFWEVL